MAATAVSSAAAASVVGAPIALVVGVVRGVIGGILAAVKQPALEVIANRYTYEIEAFGDTTEYLNTNTHSTLDKFYQQENTQAVFQKLQEAWHVDSIVSLDGVAASQSAIELAAITKLSNQMNKANNYATLVRNGHIDEASAEHLTLNTTTGVFQVNTPKDSLIKFNTPLFSPGTEESNRYQVGKNNFYTDLVINGPKEHTIDDIAGSNNVFVADNRYASTLFDTKNNVVKNIELRINAGKGDDIYIADSGIAHFNGGEGVDSINYNTSYIKGIVVRGSDDGQFIVTKTIEDAPVAVEHIRAQDVKYGKRTETVEYREISIENKTFESADMLKNVEVISASDGDDFLYGSNAADKFLGQKGDDHIHGKGGADIIDAGDGNDYVSGGEGNDKLRGGEGADKVYGDKGNDIIIQDDALSSDFLSGGAGVDTLNLAGLQLNNGQSVIVNLQKGSLQKGSVTDTIKDFENIVGTTGNDTIHGNGLNNVLVAGRGDDTLHGDAGNDLLVGDAGMNKLYGDEGNDIYLLSTRASNTISDNQGKNFAKLINEGQDVTVKFTKDAANDSVNLEYVDKSGQVTGTTHIEHASKFGVFSVSDGYYLDLENGSIQYVLSGETANANLVTNGTHVHTESGDTYVHAVAKNNNVTLDTNGAYVLNIYANTHTEVQGFRLNTDKLRLVLNESDLNYSPLKISGHDVEGGNVHIQYNDTDLTLYGAGSVSNQYKSFAEVIGAYIL